MMRPAADGACSFFALLYLAEDLGGAGVIVLQLFEVARIGLECGAVRNGVRRHSLRRRGDRDVTAEQCAGARGKEGIAVGEGAAVHRQLVDDRSMVVEKEERHVAQPDACAERPRCVDDALQKSAMRWRPGEAFLAEVGLLRQQRTPYTRRRLRRPVQLQARFPQLPGIDTA